MNSLMPESSTADSTPMSPGRCFLTNGSRTMAHAIAWYSLCLEAMLKPTGVQVPEEPGLMEYATRLWLEMMRFVPRTPGWSQNKAEIMLLIDRFMRLALSGKQ
jgi:hypothetical protein